MAIRQNSRGAASRSLGLPAATTLAVLCMSMSVTAAQSQSRVATLTCRANATMELTTKLRQPVRCHYVSPWGRTQSYSGVIARFEGDTASTVSRFMQWSVLTASSLARGALVGRYVAAGGAGGTGADANDLIGAGEGARSIVLRPSPSARGRSRFNLASGVKDISIDRRSGSRKSAI
jgi:hypothetical protein